MPIWPERWHGRKPDSERRRQAIRSQDYVLEITIPNVSFQLSMAYAILRHNGVDASKMALLDRITWVEG